MTMHLPPLLNCVNTAGKHAAAAPQKNSTASYQGRVYRLIDKLPLSARLKTKLIEKLCAGKMKAVSASKPQATLQAAVQALKKDIRGLDHCARRQAAETMLCAIYSDMKDQFCSNIGTPREHPVVQQYLERIGQAAQEIGLPGKLHKGAFVPNGAGANVFVAALFTLVMRTQPSRADIPDSAQLRLAAKDLLSDVAREMGYKPQEFHDRLARIHNEHAPKVEWLPNLGEIAAKTEEREVQHPSSRIAMRSPGH